MTAEQLGEAVDFILSGTVKVDVEQEDGSDVIMAILGPGEIVGEISALGQTYPFLKRCHHRKFRDALDGSLRVPELSAEVS